jgi:hypothetical protein
MLTQKQIAELERQIAMNNFGSKIAVTVKLDGEEIAREIIRIITGERALC